jgi:hypothetical protein
METLVYGKVRVTIPPIEHDVDVRISGVTERIPPELFAVSEGMLKAKVIKSKQQEELEPDPAGEDVNAES